MAQVTGYTAERMKEIEDNTIIGGVILDGNLILQKRNGEEINAGPVIGPEGPIGPTGTGAHPMTDMTDVDTTGADVGDTLVWNGTNWVPGLNIKVQNVAPSNPDVNDLWVDTTT